MYTVYGDAYNSDSDYTNGTKTVRFKVNKNVVLKYIRTSIIIYNNPNITNLTASLHYDKPDNTKGDKILDSLTTHTKAQLITLNNGVKDIYFQFNNITLHSDEWYHFALKGVASGLSDSSHISWKTSYPDPVYKKNLSITFANLPKFPYEFSLVGSDF